MSSVKPDPFEIIDRFKNTHQWSNAQWISLPDLSAAHRNYQEWLAKGYQGEMSYLERHSPLKTSPHQLLAEAKSAIVITKPYVPAFAPHSLLQALRIAAYARNWDYHEIFQNELEALGQALLSAVSGLIFRCGTDTLPLLERDVARQAGLGWIGKNTCLIHPQQGSFFLIGTVLLNQEPPQISPPPIADFCGTCRRCIEACPTQALGDDDKTRVLDARRCISYWSIEAKSLPPPELSHQFSDWFFGCDICQAVCPWNEKAFRVVKKNISQESPPEAVLSGWTQAMENSPLRQLDPKEQQAQWQDLLMCLTISESEFRRLFKGTPLERRKRKGLRRNALRVIENLCRAQIPISKDTQEEFLRALHNQPVEPDEFLPTALLEQIKQLPAF